MDVWLAHAPQTKWVRDLKNCTEGKNIYVLLLLAPMLNFETRNVLFHVTQTVSLTNKQFPTPLVERLG